MDEPEVAPGVIDDGEYIRIRKSDLPEVEYVTDVGWKTTWGREVTEEDGPEAHYDDALVAIAQAEYWTAHPERF